MRIQPRQHAANGVVDQGFIVNFLNVIGLDAIENFNEGLQVLQRQALGGVAIGEHAVRQRQAATEGDSHDQGNGGAGEQRHR